jgi:nucleotide-binding universal stress UspA family protein
MNAHADRFKAPNPLAFRQILCAVDFTPKSLPLLRSAAILARQLGAELRLAHAIPVLEASTELSLSALGTPKLLYEAAQKEIDKIQREAGTNAEACIETGDVGKVVRRAALCHGADLVVIGRGRILETFGSFRTNSYSILRESPCPVLSAWLGRCREARLADSVANRMPLEMA